MGGIVFLICAYANKENRAIYLGVGSFVIVVGIGLVVAKPITAEQRARMRGSKSEVKPP